MPTHIRFDRKKVRQFCRENGIRRLALFGSLLHEDFEPDSDVDVLVEFEPHVQIGYIGLAGLEIELEELLRHSVHLNTARMINPRFRDQVKAEAQILYASSA